MFDKNYDFTCIDRFLKYVKIDTQANEESTSFPSTEKQKDLSLILFNELNELGLKNVELDENCYVYAELPSNTTKDVPVIVFISHVDTSPEVTGKDVNPVIHRNYNGEDIVLPKDNTQVLMVAENPELLNQIGNDIITTDGTTLLGADDKAGVAEIMDAMRYLTMHPEIKHGTIKVCFTPDEEVGRGTEKINLQKINAKFGYTIDGESLGEVESETFCADSVLITIKGHNCHPGYGKGVLTNSIKIAAELLEKLPKNNLSPETTDKRQGYVHPYVFNGGVDETTVKFLIRDFEETGLVEKEGYLKILTDEVVSKYPKASYKFEVNQSYRNMKYIIDQHPEVIEVAKEAVLRSEIGLRLSLIRGGTDGSRLSFMGLPCPNIFAGGHNFHSRLEWISIFDMKKAVEVIVKIAAIWEEKSK